jgi:CheY-like chemotaxis protein
MFFTYHPFMNPSISPLRILLVEDDIDDCMFFKDALTETGVNTTLRMAISSTGIIDLIGTDPEKFPHMIFLDLNMPLVSGHECLEIIRSVPDLDSIPIVIYSTSAIRQEIESTFNGGANLYLQKPSSFQLLVTALKKILQMDWKNYMKERDRGNFVFKHLQSQRAA